MRSLILKTRAKVCNIVQKPSKVFVRLSIYSEGGRGAKHPTPSDNSLPKYIEHYLDKKGNEGYRVNKDGQRKAFLSSSLTMEDKLKMAMDHISGTTNYELHAKASVVRKNPQSFGLPKYMKYMKSTSSEGYRVDCQPHKFTKSFTAKSMTMDQKKELALKYLSEQLTIHSQPQTLMSMA